MVQLHKTFGLTTLGLLFLFMVGWTSTAFSQGEKTVKEMIIKTIDENGIEHTHAIESDGLTKEDIFMRGPSFLDEKLTSGSLLKKVIMLGEGEQIPTPLQTEIEAMGIDMNKLMQQFDAAEKSVRIYQENGKPAIIEVDSDLSLELPTIQGRQPQIRKRIMRMDGEGLGNSFEEEKTIDVDVDIQDFDGYEGGTIKIIKKECEKTRAKCCDKAGKCCAKSAKCCEGAACQKPSKARLGVFLEEGKGGAIVQDVMEKSAADRGGILEGDIIIQVNKAKINSNQALINEIKKYQPGDAVTVKYTRKGKKQKSKVTLQAAPTRTKHRLRHADMGGMFPYSRQNAVDCEKACKTPMLGVMINEMEDKGVRVSMIFMGSGAQKSGLQKEDIITKIGNTAVSTTEELVEQIKAKKPGDQIQVSYFRDGKAETVKVELSSQSLSSFNPTCDCNNPDFMQSTGVDAKEVILVKPGAMEMPTMPLMEEKITRKPQLEIEKFQLFPNPNQGSFTVTFQLDSKAPVMLSVVDVTGKEVYAQKINDFGGSLSEQIDVSKNAKGIYFVNVIQGERVFSKQFVFN